MVLRIHCLGVHQPCFLSFLSVSIISNFGKPGESREKVSSPPRFPSTEMITHLLFESASGYAIFDVKLHEDIGARSHAVQESIKDLAKFGKMVTLLSFSPFKSAAQALENANDVSEGKYYGFFLRYPTLVLNTVIIPRYSE